MNYFDVIVVAVLGLCILQAYRTGLVISLFNLVSWIVALVLSNFLYPFVSKILRDSFLYKSMKKSLLESMDFLLKDLGGTIHLESDLINSLSVPEFMKRSLLENNNPEIYRLLNVSSIGEYIVGHIANMAINAISMLGVFVVVIILLRVISVSLSIITMLPVINSMNKIGGAFVGFLQGTLIVWIGMVISVIFFARPEYQHNFETINNSLIAVHFYNNNMVLELILRIFA